MLRTIAATIATVLTLGVAGPASARPEGGADPGRSLFLCVVNEPCPILPPCEWKRGCNDPAAAPVPAPSCKWKVKRHNRVLTVRACRVTF